MSLSILREPPVQVNLNGRLENLEGLKEQWELIPYHVNSSQVAKEANDIIALLNNADQAKPSILAKLPASAKNMTTVMLIDNLFRSTIEEYRQDLINATAKDFEHTRQARQNRDTAADFHYAVATGAVRLSSKTPDIPVIKHLVGPLLSFIGSIYGMINRDEFVEEKIARESSVKRDEWLEGVIVKEEQRVKKVYMLISLRVKAIYQGIENDAKQNLSNQKLVEELKILDVFNDFMCPNTPLKINNMPVLEYLDQSKVDN